MSETLDTTAEPEVPPPADPDPEVERVARINGWKPKEEFAGDPTKWVPADRFVARGLEDPKILADRNKILSSRFDNLERRYAADTQAIRAELKDATETVGTMTKMLRTAEERAYQRARAELKAQQAKAVEAGDMTTYQSVDRQLEELDKTKPPVDVPKPPAPPTPAPAVNSPAVERFFEENPWYDKTGTRPERDAEMMRFADVVYNGIRTTQPGLSEEDQLAIVNAEVRNRFPAKFSRPNGAARAVVSDDDAAPAAVSPSSQGTSTRRTANRFTFDTMPKESRDAYGKYVKQLEGKGPALTKDEWATYYWEQFRDDGNP